MCTYVLHCIEVLIWVISEYILETTEVYRYVGSILLFYLVSYENKSGNINIETGDAITFPL